MQKSVREIIAVQEHLKNHPRGLSVSEIADELSFHRNTTARYLDILQFRGDVDVRRVGTSKIYYTSHRVPVSTLLSFWSAPLVILNSRREVAMVNNAALALLGCPLDVLYGEHTGDIPFPLFQDPAITQQIDRAVKGEQAKVMVETRIRGRLHRLDVHLIPVIFESRGHGCALAFFDRTTAWEAEKGRARAEERYAALMADQQEFVVNTRPDLTVTFANPAFGRHIGRTPEECRGLNLISRITAGEREAAAAVIGGCSPDSPAATLSARTLLADGSIGYEEWTMRAIFSERGTITGYHCVGRDVTATVRLRDQLKRYHTQLEAIIGERTQEMRQANRDLIDLVAEKDRIEQELLFIRFAFDHASDSILLFDRDGRIFRANETACDLLGYAREEIGAITVFEVNPSLTPRLWEQMWADARHGKKQRVVSVHRKKDGLIFDVEVSRTFVEYGGKMYFCSIARELAPAPGEA